MVLVFLNFTISNFDRVKSHNIKYNYLIFSTLAHLTLSKNDNVNFLMYARAFIHVYIYIYNY